MGVDSKELSGENFAGNWVFTINYLRRKRRKNITLRNRERRGFAEKNGTG